MLQWLAENCELGTSINVLYKVPARTSEEDDIDSQDSNTPIDHGHLARNLLNKDHNAGRESLSHLRTVKVVKTLLLLKDTVCSKALFLSFTFYHYMS